MRFFLSLITLLSLSSFEVFANDVSRLETAYPDLVQAVHDDEIVWKDGTHMSLFDEYPNKTPLEKLDHPALFDQLNDVHYIPGFSEVTEENIPFGDPGRIRFEPFFKKMYGQTKDEVKTHLVTIYWMPKIFGFAYPLEVTTINQVHEKLMKISNELELLVLEHPEYEIFLKDPGETFCWRYIANTTRLSNHSFGMTIDINPTTSNYWQWDLIRDGKEISETAPLVYKNNVPIDIVMIFEKYGFIWGGKWLHYDSMHFEYRPEIYL